jgi:acetyl-CoA acyltransferase
MKSVYVCSVTRTAMGKAPRGAFKTTRPDDLLAAVLKSLVAKNPNLDPKAIGDIIIGCAMPEREQGMNVARVGSLLAGLPIETSAMTINRFCCSGVQAVFNAAQAIQSGLCHIAIGGGVESMSMIGFGSEYAVNQTVFDNENIALSYGMGITAENVATKYNISRQDQDAFAFQSHQKAMAAIQNGFLVDEITPFTVSNKIFNGTDFVTKTKVVSQDEGPRPDTTMEGLAKLKPVFAAKGSVTAGNSSQMSDGAGAILLADEEGIKQFGLTPMLRLVTYAVAGVAPEIMGIGPIASIPKALNQAGLTMQDIGWVELNEAFAAQSLAIINTLGLDPAVINPYGGAIALGHPLGATGAIKTATLAYGMQRTNAKYGMVTMCIGGGMGFTGIFEKV